MQKNNHSKTNEISIKCVLEENKICDNCRECFVCDLDPGKICDNCAKCLETPDFKAIIIDDILMLEETEDKKKKKKNKSTKNPINR
jgi:hypothetical protein